MQQLTINSVTDLREAIKRFGQQTPGSYQVFRVLVTPTLAQKILKSFWLGYEDTDGPTQRSISVPTVTKLARAMRNGSFTPGTKTIDFAHPGLAEIGGKLVDGYHRLHGVVESGADQVLHFQFNVTMNDLANVDIPRLRTVRDAANAIGRDATNIEGRKSVAMMFDRHKRGLYPIGKEPMGHSETFELIDVTPFAVRAAEIVKLMPSGLRLKSIGFCYAYFCEAGYEDEAEMFFEDLREENFERRAPNGTTGPIRLLSVRLRADYKIPHPRHSGNRAATDVVQLVVDAFNKYLKGWTGHRIMFPKGWPHGGRRLKLPALVRI